MTNLTTDSLEVNEYMNAIGKSAKMASQQLSTCSELKINQALSSIAKLLITNTDVILIANAKDVQEAHTKGISSAMIERLTLTPATIKSMADGIETLIGLRTPLGDSVKAWKQPNGLSISQIRVPIGVVGIIYESRPNVTIDAGTLCLKSKNAAILRGGSEAYHSNLALIKVLQEGLALNQISPDAIQYIDRPDRQYAVALMSLREYVDVLIPRGGAGLIKAVVENSKVPVIETGVGNCHIYVDDSADFDMAFSIIKNAKLSRNSVCNAAETLILSQSLPEGFSKKLISDLQTEGVIFHGCEKSVASFDNIQVATFDDFANEYLSNDMALIIVDCIEEALSHIDCYGTKHSEAIITSCYDRAEYFLDRVDAAAVYVNASTRFTDGSEFGFGAEIGISTQKLHARGPMGLEALTTTKYQVKGNGQIR